MRILVSTASKHGSTAEIGHEIAGILAEAGFDVDDVAPDGVVNGDQFDTYRYKLGVTGPFHQVAEFLANIASLRRIVAPINLTLSPTGRVGELRPKKGEQMLDAKFQIQTYVTHASAKPAAPAKAGAP